MHRGPETSPPDRWLRRQRRRSRRRRRVRRVLATALLGVAAFVSWGVVEGASAAAHLRATEQATERLVAGAVAPEPDLGAVDDAVDSALDGARGADEATSSLPWRWGMSIPGLGRPLRSIRELTIATRTLTDGVLPAVRQSAPLLQSDGLRSPDGRINLEAIRQSGPSIRMARDAASSAVRGLAGSRPSGIAAVDRRTTALLHVAQRATGALDTAVRATEVLPRALGAERAQTYLIAFQTPAEARATGGLVGSYMIVRAEDGRLQLVRTVADLGYRELPPLDLGSDFRDLYGRYDAGGLWQNSNLSPHFPYAARIWRDLNRRETGLTVDGVIAADPVTLSYLMPAIGSITLPDGEKVTAQSVVPLTQSEAYATFANRRDSRKRYLSSIAEQVFVRLSGNGPVSAWPALKALMRATSEGRLSVWSADSRVQAAIADTPLGHLLPYGPGQLHHVVITNSAGSKLDYYLSRRIEVTRSRCGTAQRTEVTVTLSSNAPTTGLPPYVTGADWPNGGSPMTVSLYATWGARLLGLAVDARPVGVGIGRELGHPVFYTLARVYPGRDTTVRFSVDEPATTATSTLPEQPLTRPSTTVVRDVGCAVRR